MRISALVSLTVLSLMILSCGKQQQIIVQPLQVTATQVALSSATSKPIATEVITSTSPPLNAKILPDTIQVDGNKVHFTDWGFVAEFPTAEWQFEPSMYRKEPDLEGSVFIRRPGFIDNSGQEFQPSAGIFFFAIPEGTDVISFSTMLRTRMGEGFPSIDSMFGYEGTEPILKINALGYYGKGQRYMTYIIHSVKGKVGIQVSLEIVESLLDEAKPEFYAIMQSLEFTQ